MMSCILRMMGWMVGLVAVASAGAARAPKVPEVDERPLAAIWNDADFGRRFFGYEASVEPKLSAEEQAHYRSLDERRLFTEDPARAADELEAKMTPSSSALLEYSAGSLRLGEGDVAGAIKLYGVAVDKFPRFMRAHRSLGMVLAREGQYGEALPHLTKAIELGGAEAVIYGLLGFCHLNLGNYVSAEAAYQSAVLHDPLNLDWKLGLIKSFIEVGQYRRAAEMLDELIQAHPDKANLWVLQANVFIQQEQPMKAAVNLEALRRLGQATVPDLALLGDLYMAQDSAALALSAYVESMEMDDGSRSGRALRTAEILVSRGSFEEAGALFAKIHELYATVLAEEDLTKMQRLEARVALGLGEGDRAIGILEEIIVRNPLDGETLLLAGDYYARHDQREKADFRYETATNVEAYRAEAWVKQAELRVQARKYAEAVDLLRKAQKLRPLDHIQRYLEKVELAAARAVRS
jgi:tetratricopeptide (TPR) repeat protein